MIDWVNNIGVGERAGLFEVVPHRPEKYQVDGKRTSYLPFWDFALCAVSYQLFAMVGPRHWRLIAPSYLPWGGTSQMR
jgi:hypothetical protein